MEGARRAQPGALTEQRLALVDEPGAQMYSVGWQMLARPSSAKEHSDWVDIIILSRTARQLWLTAGQITP